MITYLYPKLDDGLTDLSIGEAYCAYELIHVLLIETIQWMFFFFKYLILNYIIRTLIPWYGSRISCADISYAKV